MKKTGSQFNFLKFILGSNNINAINAVKRYESVCAYTNHSILKSMVVTFPQSNTPQINISINLSNTEIILSVLKCNNAEKLDLK